MKHISKHFHKFAACAALVLAATPAVAQLPSAAIPPSAATPAATRQLPTPPDPREPSGLRLVGPNAHAASPPTVLPTAPSRSSADPTMPSPAIRELIDQGTTRPAGGAAPPAPQPGIPEVRIRARLFAKDKPPVAVLEIAGKSLTVRLNSEIHIPGTPDAPSGVQLKVVELTPTDLRLEVLKRNQFISLN